MKLIWCPLCRDAFGLITTEWRVCKCGESGGQYNIDDTTATVGGYATVFGIGNGFFMAQRRRMSEEEQKEARIRENGADKDIWWGDYEGDVQLFHIANGRGPRLSIKVLPVKNRVDVIRIRVYDNRDYTIAGKKNRKEVLVPAFEHIGWEFIDLVKHPIS